jgi:hypothetical protein
VIDAKDSGRGTIDGVEREHLAFRNADTDWQIWIELGARPIPRKYVITNKAVAGAPQYTLRIKERHADAGILAKGGLSEVFEINDLNGLHCLTSAYRAFHRKRLFPRVSSALAAAKGRA